MFFIFFLLCFLLPFFNNLILYFILNIAVFCHLLYSIMLNQNILNFFVHKTVNSNIYNLYLLLYAKLKSRRFSFFCGTELKSKLNGREFEQIFEHKLVSNVTIGKTYFISIRFFILIFRDFEGG